MPKDLTFFATGDVAPNRPDPNTIFDEVRSIIQSGDLAFCQLEANLSTRGTPSPQARLPMRTDPRVAQAIRAAGFDVTSFASNHCMDWGPDALADTIDNLKKENLAVIGVGANIHEARRPVIMERNGTRIAFLAYNTILPQCYWAEVDRPGCAPLRAFTFYEQIEHDQPGTPCRTHSFPHRQDLQAMIADIEAVRASADVVVVSMHWGVHFVPSLIADYQRDVAHTAIDHGADLIIGHHPHILKGIEVYRGRAIFYSLGNFAIEQPKAFMAGLYSTQRQKEIENLNPNWQHDQEYSAPPDTRKTILVQCTISQGAISQVMMHPCHISTKSVPQLLAPDDALYGEVVDYIQHISTDQGLAPRFIPADGPLIINTAL